METGTVLNLSLNNPTPAASTWWTYKHTVHGMQWEPRPGEEIILELRHCGGNLPTFWKSTSIGIPVRIE